MVKGISDDLKALTIKHGKKTTNVFLEKKNMKKLTKSQNDKMIFGICGGLSGYCGLDVSIIRLLCVIGFFITGSLLFWIYMLLAIILPSDS